MRTIYRVVLLTALATSALGLAGCSSGFDLRQARHIRSQRKEKTSRRAQGRVSRRRSGSDTRHSARVRARQPAAAGNRAGAATRASQGRGCGRGRKRRHSRARAETKAQAEKGGKAQAATATGAGHCAAVSLAATAGAASRTTEQPVAGSGTGQHCVTLAFLAATRHLPALTAVGLDPKANHAAKT